MLQWSIGKGDQNSKHTFFNFATSSSSEDPETLLPCIFASLHKTDQIHHKSMNSKKSNYEFNVPTSAQIVAKRKSNFFYDTFQRGFNTISSYV
jgi:hypothetical protein